MGDSGGNQTGMKNVATKLTARFSGTPARFFFIPEYYDYPSVRKFVQANGVPEKMEFEASSGSDNIHEEYSIDAIMMLHDPKTVRLEERKKAGKTTINGADLMPLDKTLAMAKRIVDLRTQLTVDAITKAMGTAKTSQR